MILTPSFRPCGLRLALNEEWDQLLSSRAAVPPRWGLASTELGSCSSLDQVLESVQGRPDPTLRALLRLCAEGESLAGRVVLQAMLGKLLRMATADPVAGLDDYLCALWERICTYPLATRPHRVAANLALDTLKSVRRAGSWVPGVEVTPYPPSAFIETCWDRPVETSPPELRAATVIAAAVGLGLITDDTRAVLTSVYADGLSGASAAARHGKSATAIRVQCHKAVRTLARHAPELLAAA